MFSTFARLYRRVVNAYRRHVASSTLARLSSYPRLSFSAFLAGLPQQFGIRQAVTAAFGPHLCLLQPSNIQLQALICAIISHGLQQASRLPTYAHWQTLVHALVAPGPVLLMCGNPVVGMVSPWGFKRVTSHNFREMLTDLNDPNCKSKYVCAPGMAATGWNCYNPNVRIALFNIHNHAVIAQANARIRRPNKPEWVNL